MTRSADIPIEGRPGEALPRLILARGSALEQGQSIGEATADLVVNALDSYETRFAHETGLSELDLARAADRFSASIEAYSPNVYAMLVGLAEGADVALRRIVLLNARTEILYGATSSERDGACTTAAVLAPRTSSGHTYLLQNWDWRDILVDQTFLLGTEDAEGFRVLTLTEAGMVAKSGINSAGIGLGVNLLASDRQAQRRGVPFHVIARRVLESRRPSTALRATLDCERSSSGNLMLAFAGGEAIDIEVVPNDFTLEHPHRSVLTHANHFRNRTDWKDTFGPRAALSGLRDERLRRLLTADESIAESTMVAALRDHFSHPDGICRHVDQSLPGDEQVATLHSLVIDVDARHLWIAAETPCTNPYYRVALDDFFTSTAPHPNHFPEETDVTRSNHS